MDKFVSPLRYPGGKLKVVDYIKQVFEANDLCDGHYIEPYAGGASVALALLQSEYAHTIHINDIDRSIYAFWHSVLHQPEALCRLITDTPVTMTEWERQKEVQKRKEDKDTSLLELGFSTFFLNRTNRSGILSAGVIGGKDQTGPYKMDARYNKTDLIERIESIADYAERITLTNKDAVKLVKSLSGLNGLSSLNGSKTLLYLDPPYYIKGRDLYLNYYTDDDHRQIARAISAYPGKWLISYDAVPFLKELYKDYRQREYYLSYSAGNPSKGKEIMVYSDGLVVPEGEIVRVGKSKRR